MDVKIEKLVYGGDGLGHQDGHTVFVPYVLPGEVVRVRAVEQKKKFIRGRVQQILVPSLQRVAPDCAHFADCGGCHYQHIPYEAQLEFKAAILCETLLRLGGITWAGPIHTHPSPPFYYRNRAQWKVRALGGGPVIGYFQAASTALCSVKQCPVLSPRLEEVFSALRSLLAKGDFPASLREVEAYVDQSEAKVLLNCALESFSVSTAKLTETIRTDIPGVESVLFQDIARDHFELVGPGYLMSRVGGAEYRVGHLSFFQANRFLLEELMNCAVAGVQGRLALDLFAGVGLFAVPLARQFQRVLAVESNGAAARDLAANIAAAEVPAQAVNTSVEDVLRDWSEVPDLMVLDPPRAGLSAESAQRIIALAPQHVRYVSCDPSTLARDLKLLLAGGFHIEEIHFFDMFPQTFHIETLVKLGRSA